MINGPWHTSYAVKEKDVPCIIYWHWIELHFIYGEVRLHDGKAAIGKTQPSAFAEQATSKISEHYPD